MKFYINMACILVNLYMFYITDVAMFLLLGGVIFFATALTHITTPEKDQEEEENDNY